MYIDKLKLDSIVNKYDNTYYRTIKMKPVGIRLRMYIYFNEENIEESTKSKVAEQIRTSKYKNILAKGYVPNWSEEVFGIKKVKKRVPWTYVLRDLNVENIVGTFY